MDDSSDRAAEAEVRPRVAVVGPYWDFWEASAGVADLRGQREQILRDIAGALSSRGMEVVCVELADAPARARELRDTALDADVVLIVVNMAAPPTHTLPLLGETRHPLVLWALDLGLGAPGDRGAIVQDGSTVGTPMLTQVLVREQRPFSFVSGALDEPTAARCATAIRVELLAHQFAGLRLARVGDPIPGYLSVDADDRSLERALGLEIVRLDPTELEARAVAADAGDLGRRIRRLHETFSVPGATDDEGFVASVRLDLGLERLVDDEMIGAGTVNCHVAQLRHGEALGVTPCFALGQSTSRGVPWTCTGDVLTAIAMLVGRRLGGAALYHEIEYLDPRTGDAVIANTGEHDRGWLPAGVEPELRSNPWYEQDPRTGLVAWFPLAPGPATLVSFTATAAEPSGFRFVTAQGQVIEESLHASPTVGGRFRFADDDPRAAWERWVMAGVNHHSALVPGSLGEAVATLARRLEVGHVTIC